eukprot:GHUV01052236.1.p1 GENE.GHUV01052236.1~~GHUV01052236.1.p1  ORF type:complete len:113 (+),score=16.18 GHUV01052236.1:244-582(+)
MLGPAGATWDPAGTRKQTLLSIHYHKQPLACLAAPRPPNTFATRSASSHMPCCLYMATAPFHSFASQKWRSASRQEPSACKAWCRGIGKQEHFVTSCAAADYTIRAARCQLV